MKPQIRLIILTTVDKEFEKIVRYLKHGGLDRYLHPTSRRAAKD